MIDTWATDPSESVALKIDDAAKAPPITVNVRVSVEAATLNTILPPTEHKSSPETFLAEAHKEQPDPSVHESETPGGGVVQGVKADPAAPN